MNSEKAKKIKEKKQHDRWSAFKIRVQLLRIWFLKNISLFIKVGVLVVICLFLTNVIGSESFLVQVLGIEELQTSFDEGGIHGTESLIAAILSCSVSVLYFMKKSKSIALEDIKSRELKIALIKARLYFDENGKLCKRLEESMQMDINGDGKVNDTPIESIHSENLIMDTRNAIGELTTILTAKIETDPDGKVVEEAELNEDLDEGTTIVTEKLFTENIGAPEIEHDPDEKSLDDKLAELNIEPEEEKVVETQEKEQKNKKPTFFGEIMRALKLAFFLPKTKNTFTDKHERKKKHREHKKEIVTKSPSIEIVDLQTGEVVDNVQNNKDIEIKQIQKTTQVSDTTNSIDDIVASVEHSKSTSTPKTKAKQINDILNSL